MHYFLLTFAIVCEIIATTLLKASEGFTKLLPSIGCAIFYVLCYYSFSKCLNGIDLGIAYAIWCAGGIVATSIISWIIFGQKMTGIGILGIVLIVTGCALVNLFGTPH